MFSSDYYAERQEFIILLHFIIVGWMKLRKVDDENRYYELNIVETEEGVMLERKWGNQDSEEKFIKNEGPFTSKEEANKELEKIFKKLTGNELGASSDFIPSGSFVPESFESYGSKFKKQKAIPKVHRGNSILPESPVKPTEDPRSPNVPNLMHTVKETLICAQDSKSKVKEEEEEQNQEILSATEETPDNGDNVAEKESTPNEQILKVLDNMAIIPGEEEEESEDESFVLDEEAPEEEEEEEEEESEGEEDTIEDIVFSEENFSEEEFMEEVAKPSKVFQRSESHSRSSITSQSILEIDIGESSMALSMFLKLFNQMAEQEKRNVLDQLPASVKVPFTLELAAAISRTFTSNDAPTQRIPKPAPPAKKQKSKKSQSIQRRSFNKPTTKKKNTKKTNTTVSESLIHTCDHVFIRGKMKGEICGKKAQEPVGDRFACAKHKHLIEKEIAKLKQKETKKSQIPRKETKVENTNRKEDILLSKRVHMCEGEGCETCKQAKTGDLRVLSYAHTVTRTPGGRSGFLKSFVYSHQNSWSVVFIGVNTAFDTWEERFVSFDALKEYFNEANIVRYQKLSNGKSSAYQLVCDPLQGSHLTLIDISCYSSSSSSHKDDSESNQEKNTVDVDDEESEHLKDADIVLQEAEAEVIAGHKVAPLEQRKIVRKILSQDNRVVGNEWNLVSMFWFDKWKEFVSFDVSAIEANSACVLSDPPGPIDNSSLFNSDDDSEFMIRKNLEQEIDFVVISPRAWNFLFKLYGGGPVIQRPLIEKYIESRTHITVELYPIQVKIIVNENEPSVPCEFSETAKIQSLIEYYARQKPSLSGNKHEIKVYRFFQGKKCEEYEDHSATLQEAGIHDGSSVYLEITLLSTQ